MEDEQAVLQAEERSYSGGAKTGAASNALLAPDRRAATYAAFKAAPRFVLLDFRCMVLKQGQRQTSIFSAERACLQHGALPCCAPFA